MINKNATRQPLRTGLSRTDTTDSPFFNGFGRGVSPFRVPPSKALDEHWEGRICTTVRATSPSTISLPLRIPLPLPSVHPIAILAAISRIPTSRGKLLPDATQAITPTKSTSTTPSRSTSTNSTA
ncbi:hypothetical protein CCMSSC00406_0007598 [Pleurotus cornucopiae]|uniref:Uncharacterized protein n=1 Tax=Pleurotus cornucopiae TaxID=5321 RepID=A0ACB7J0E2_PLECO|nr:hypothetical protein CCMSSC00406_0007598 [Pleurotus cornucopiae]